MNCESLDGLKAAFERWRGRKLHRREMIPEDLLAKARCAARLHGRSAVARATKIDWRRLTGDARQPARRSKARPRALSFSRMELCAPVAASTPFAEVETAAGMKVRLFSQTSEVLELLSSLLASRGKQ